LRFFDWFYVAVDRYGRPDPKGLAKRLNHVPGWFIRRIAKAKLASVLRHVWRNSPVQREAWQKAGVRYRDLGRPEVMQRIPFCDVQHLTDEPEAYVCVAREELLHVLTTSGTTGHAKKLYFTRDDLIRQTRMLGTNLRRLPGASRAIGMFRVNDPTWSAGAVVRRGIEEAGMFGLLAGNLVTPNEAVKLIRTYGIDVILSSASCVHRLTVEAETDLKALGMRYILLSTQAWSESLRTELEDAWGAKVLDAYGTNECGCGIASECLEQAGLHVSEADFWLEIIDPATGEAVADGEEGELVVTTLSRRGMPLVRYRVGDLTRFLPREKRCKCGLAVRKIARIRGRTDDMLIVGTGLNVFPDEFDEAILGVPGVTDFQLTVERDGFCDVLHLVVETEIGGETLKQTMTEAMRRVKYVKMSMDETKTLRLGAIRNVPRGSLTKDRPKSRRILDQREV